MTDQLERELRQLFAEDADRAPLSAGLGEGALRRVRQRRHAQLAWATGAVAATALTMAVISGGLLGGQPVGDQVARPPAASKSPVPTLAGTAPKGPQGPLDSGVAASCAEQYSMTSLTGRAFAFDGTVTAIGPARSNRPGTDYGLIAATFTVNQWYRGGSGATVTVDMSPPGIGTRLLVSGEPRWGGAPLTDAIAHPCGFTRYYDKATADSWRAAFG